MGDANTQGTGRQVRYCNRTAKIEIPRSTRFNLLVLVRSCIFDALPDFEAPYELYQPFTYPEENTVSSVFCNFLIFYVDILFCLFSFLHTSHSFRHESTFHFFCFALFFFCTSLINFCYFICFLYLCILLSDIFKHTKFLQLNSIYINMRFNL